MAKMQRDEHGLTPKQAWFVSEYIKDWNVNATAKRMGLKLGAANQYMNREPVRKRLEQIKAEINRESVATAQEVAEYLTRVMRGEETEPVMKGVGVGRQEEIQQQVKSKDRLKAAELLGKHYSMFTDKVEMSGEVPVVIIDDLRE